MRQNGLSWDEDTQRDPLLEAAFTHFVQQAQAPAAFAARVRLRVALLGPEGQSGFWCRRVATWLTGTGVSRRAWMAVLVTGLVLSVLGNVWLGVRLVEKTGPASRPLSDAARHAQDVPRQPTPGGAVYRTLSDDTHLSPPRAGGTSQETRGQFRLAFADDVRVQELHPFLHSLRATINAGPSPQGVYTVLVPLPRLHGSPSSPGASDTAESLRLLLEELQAHPYVRLAESVSPPP